MKKNTTIQDKIDQTFNVLDAIKEVPLREDFSDIVLSKLNTENDKKGKINTWMTPQLQFAAMIIVLLVNASVIYYAFKTSDSNENVSGIERFAKEYLINSESSISLN
ncbi:MAG: hypothetical protein JXQ93_12885 [Flavobacteriaceae bacterium]